jgi:hypothetical protein
MSAFDPENFRPPELPTPQDGLFNLKGHPHLNACIGWRGADWNLYAAGYKTAADMLATHVIEHANRQDTLVYPILFLYRQYIELCVKEIIRSGLEYLDRDAKAPRGHDLGQLWAQAEKLLTEMFPGDSVEQVRQTGRIIRDFNKVDPQSDGFRYPENKQGEQTLQGIRYINIENVREVVERLSIILDGARTQISVYQDHKDDMQRYYAPPFETG